MSNFMKAIMKRGDLIIRIAGEGGQGVVTAGELLMRAVARSGLHILSDSTFSSEIRGGAVSFHLRTSPLPILSQGDRVDVLVALSPRGYAENRTDLAPGSVLVFDAEAIRPERLEGVTLYAVPMTAICHQLGTPLSRNMLVLGVVAQLLGIPADLFREQIRTRFSKRGAAVVTDNLRAFESGITYAKEQLEKKDPYLLPSGKRTDDFLLLNGNEAIGLGALIAGCRFYSYCPITPATTLGDWIGTHLTEMGGTVIQAEDAAESLALAVGASCGGMEAMTGTSGPGLDSMQEFIGFSSMAEVPVVIINVQRVGPSSGIPTRTEQSDLFSAIYGNHGDVPKIVLAASDVRDCLYLTIDAFHLAERYRVPVILLSDSSLSRRSQMIPRPTLPEVRTAGRGVREGTGFPNVHLPTAKESPSSTGPAQEYEQKIITGLEHTGTGRPNDDSEVHREMTDRRFRKLEGLEEDGPPVEREGPVIGELGIISWGTTQVAVREAVQQFCAIGRDVAALYPKRLWPLPVKTLKAFAASVKKLVVVEANKQGQFGHMIRAGTGLRCDSIKTYTGSPISSWDIFGRENL